MRGNRQLRSLQSFPHVTFAGSRCCAVRVQLAPLHAVQLQRPQIIKQVAIYAHATTYVHLDITLTVQRAASLLNSQV